MPTNSASAIVGGPIQLSASKTRSTAEAGSKKGAFYKSLPIRFRPGEFDYWQIYRKGNAAIYTQICRGCPNPSICYEVIRIRRREGFQVDGRFVEPAEIYPKTEAWGTDGFTFTDKDAAFAKLREIAASLNAPAPFGLKRKGSCFEKSPT
jgi:hypothetical protein